MFIVVGRRNGYRWVRDDLEGSGYVYSKSYLIFLFGWIIGTNYKEGMEVNSV